MIMIMIMMIMIMISRKRNDREGTEMDNFSELRNCETVHVAIIVVS